ncbi:MAG: phosphoribosylaminoimidazolesuccinocarboxamide synthase [Vampirovibrionales bacterium]|nr:phosphoribosylaminoimidazolesuccinocarboxamide synthase [Vampirovibrionales bacterium]
MTAPIDALIREGKAKRLFQGAQREEVRVQFKNSATAFNGEKFAEFPGKGALNATISAMLFEFLEANGLPTCFLGRTNADDALIYRSLTMIPLEVVVRNRAYGSVRKRFDLQEGVVFSAPQVEFFLKDDALGDPQISEAMIVERGLLPSGVTIDLLRRRALQANELFIAYFAARDIVCADFKLEFGVDASGALRVGDELSPDNFRLRDAQTARVLDKDVFRQDLADLVETYQALLARLQSIPNPTNFPLRRYDVEVFISSRQNILNPESRAVLNSLRAHGHAEVSALRAGKRFELTLEAPTMIAAERHAAAIAAEVLSNPVIEDADFRIAPAPALVGERLS